MLEPREANVPVLFLVFVVLPLVAYVLLGKWSEVSKKMVRISLLAELAAEEARRAEVIATATATVTPLVPTPKTEFQLSTSKNEYNGPTSKNGFHACARCSALATTRCSKCKSVRYCSGKCQIIHWKQVHKHKCKQLEKTSLHSSPLASLIEDSVVHNERLNSQLSAYNNKLVGTGKAPPDDKFHSSTSRWTSATMDCPTFETSQTSMLERRTAERRVYCISDTELLRENATVFDFHDEMSSSSSWSVDSTSNFSPKEASIRHKSRPSASAVSADKILRNHNFNHSSGYTYGQGTAGSTTQESHGYQSQHVNIHETRNSAKCGTYAHEDEIDFTSNGGNFLKEENEFIDEGIEFDGSQAMNGSIKARNAMNPLGPKGYKSAKSCMKVVSEQSCSEKEWKGPITDESKGARVRDTSPTQGSNGVRRMGITKMMGSRKSNKLRRGVSELGHDQHRKIKMLFPYEEFVILFQYGVVDLSPRGLLNCGNSCYANAVLQCLTCTKPLVIYLLQRSHSSACCRKRCLLCELEQHVMMLREGSIPLSPGRILSHMRTNSCQLGDGSQEDAHEFLRLLVASMQSICLEGHGGENKVDPRLQETTFIQHTFGGQLWSKVKCLRCHHESERYENIMDLTLEIFGWVESLEDALTQFTTPEDLDGENMYKCARCASYVRARKQLSIHEAPNILTIVLKRFQEGSYGKINKCITFPELLDMAPFMTGTSDTPPLYVLYAVAVHLDTQNASFSGHYVSYVKDMQGNWFRIDDTEVYSVPMRQVMSEGAYILFYMRSFPRPQRMLSGKAMQQQLPASARHSAPKTQKLSRHGQNNPCSQYVGPESLSDPRPEIVNGFTEHTSSGMLRQDVHKNMLPVFDRYPEPPSMEFPEAASSDWSLFTSSDEASFTTESARDSFSTVDYADACNVDPFYNVYSPESARHNTICSRTFLSSKPETRFILSEKVYVLDSYL